MAWVMCTMLRGEKDETRQGTNRQSADDIRHRHAPKTMKKVNNRQRQRQRREIKDKRPQAHTGEKDKKANTMLVGTLLFVFVGRCVYSSIAVAGMAGRSSP